MKPPFKSSPDKIEQELYNAIKLKKGEDTSLDAYLTKISNDYFLFQQNLSNLLDGKTSIQFNNSNFEFELNNIITVKKNKVFIKYDSTKEKLKLNIGIIWHGFICEYAGFFDFPYTSTFISPGSSNSINLVGLNLNYKDSDPIKNYFYNHLKKLDNKFHEKIRHISLFLINLYDVSVSLKKSGLSINDIIGNETQSNVAIYNLLRENKEIIALTSDSDIFPQLEKMKKYHASNKIGVSLK